MSSKVFGPFCLPSKSHSEGIFVVISRSESHATSLFPVWKCQEKPRQQTVNICLCVAVVRGVGGWREHTCFVAMGARDEVELLLLLKGTVEGLLTYQVANVWSIYGGLNRLHCAMERIFKHGYQVFNQEVSICLKL